MTLEQIERFLAVAEYMSFTQAARERYISQPAVSRQMANLEDELGTPLFERARSTIQLTAAGRHLFQQLAAAVQHAGSGSRIQLVAGKDIEVAAQLLHVRPGMDNALRAIDKNCAIV